MLKDELNPEITQLDFIDFDREFGAFLLRFTGKDLPEVAITGMLAAYELRSGNPVLELSKYAGKTIVFEADKTITLPSVSKWMEFLFQTGTASFPADALRTPLLFTGETTLMLHRYAGYADNLRLKLYTMRRDRKSVV